MTILEILPGGCIRFPIFLFVADLARDNRLLRNGRSEWPPKIRWLDLLRSLMDPDPASVPLRSFPHRRSLSPGSPSADAAGARRSVSFPDQLGWHSQVG